MLLALEACSAAATVRSDDGIDVTECPSQGRLPYIIQLVSDPGSCPREDEHDGPFQTWRSPGFLFACPRGGVLVGDFGVGVGGRKMISKGACQTDRMVPRQQVHVGGRRQLDRDSSSEQGQEETEVGILLRVFAPRKRAPIRFGGQEAKVPRRYNGQRTETVCLLRRAAEWSGAEAG